MATVKEFEKFFEERIPRALSMPGDPDGLAVCIDPNTEVRAVVAAVDTSLAAIGFAAEKGAQMVISHHPFIFDPIKRLNPDTPTGKRVITAVQKGVSVMGFHTRLDAIDGGVNDCLCQRLGLPKGTPFGDGCGRYLELEREYSFEELSALVGKKLGTTKLSGLDCGHKIKKLAMLGGSGKSFLMEAYSTGADAFLTGEVAHSTFIDARELGISIICATHYYTEAVVVPQIAAIVKEGFPNVEVYEFYEEY